MSPPEGTVAMKVAREQLLEVNCGDGLIDGKESHRLEL